MTNSSSSFWEVRVKKRGLSELKRAPRPDRERLADALEEMRSNPLTGDIVPLKGQEYSFRRRVGDWRIFFDLERDKRLVQVRAIEHRTTTTYRKR